MGLNRLQKISQRKRKNDCDFFFYFLLFHMVQAFYFLIRSSREEKEAF